MQRWCELVAASGSQESASSLTSVILSMDLRISATRFSVSAPDTSCLKQTDTRAIIPAVHKQPATEKKARVPAQRESSSTQPRFGTLDFVCLFSDLHACALASDPGSSSRDQGRRQVQMAGWRPDSSVETDSKFWSLSRPRWWCSALDVGSIHWELHS